MPTRLNLQSNNWKLHVEMVNSFFLTTECAFEERKDWSIRVTPAKPSKEVPRSAVEWGDYVSSSTPYYRNL